MKIVMLLFACMASPDFTFAMRPGFQLPNRPSVGSSSRSIDNYEIPPGTIVYLRVTADITLFGNLRVPQLIRGERANSTYGQVFVYGDAMTAIGDRQAQVGYRADLDAWDERHRPVYEIQNIIIRQDSYSVYIERSALPPLKSTLALQYIDESRTRRVTFIGPHQTRPTRGTLRQVAENEPVWIPWQVGAMRPGCQLPPGPSVGSSSGSIDNYDLPPGTIVYLRVTADITLFGNLRVMQRIYCEIANSPYGHIFVYGDAMRTNGDRQVRVKYGADFHAWDYHRRSEYEICDIIGAQDSYLVYIERPALPPLKSTLSPQYRHISETRKVTFVGITGRPVTRGPLQQVAPNEPVWIPWQESRNEPGPQRQSSIPQQFPRPGGRTTAEMNFQPGIHILMRGSEPGFRFENGQFCRGQNARLVNTVPKDGDIVTENGAPIGRFRGVDEKWYPLNLTPRK